MSKAEPFVMQSALLLLTWLGAYLRIPGTFSSFSVSHKAVAVNVDHVETFVS